MNPLRSVGARLALALAIVVAGALGLVYVIVVPSLQTRLVNAKLSQLRSALPEIEQEVPQSSFEDWTAFLETASGESADARVVVYQVDTPAIGGRHAFIRVVHDSHSLTSTDVADDAMAQRAADSFSEVSGTVSRSDNSYAEVATPVSPFGTILLLSASLHDALANVHTVQTRLVEAGVLALLVAIGIGYGAAYLFARRIRRLEAAAERIAAGSFDEPVHDPSGDELGQLARAFENMRQRLSQLERARREFIGNASHELRTPLFSLRGFIELLTDEDLDESTRSEFLETMREQVDRLQRLAEDLLDLTRLDAGRMHLERRAVDLGELAQELYEEFRGVAHATGHPLSVEPGETRALADDERVLRIGRALVENAIRHTAPGTPVRIRSTAGAFRTAWLTVADEGPGVPAEHARHVFERFYRVGGTQASGSGLGLAIAHELAEAMGGTLELESTPGHTAFTLRLPAAPDVSDEGIPRENAPALTG